MQEKRIKMTGKILAKYLSIEDLDGLKLIDKDYSDKYGLEPVVSQRSLNFYSRSGHSFASLDSSRYSGFIFAHAIWNGAKAVMQVSRLVVEENNTVVAKALIEAVVKSAYDAAVYDLQVIQPNKDDLGLNAFLEKEFQIDEMTFLTRRLGSR